MDFCTDFVLSSATFSLLLVSILPRTNFKDFFLIRIKELKDHTWGSLMFAFQPPSHWLYIDGIFGHWKKAYLTLVGLSKIKILSPFPLPTFRRSTCYFFPNHIANILGWLIFNKHKQNALLCTWHGCCLHFFMLKHPFSYSIIATLYDSVCVVLPISFAHTYKLITNKYVILAYMGGGVNA